MKQDKEKDDRPFQIEPPGLMIVEAVYKDAVEFPKEGIEITIPDWNKEKAK